MEKAELVRIGKEDSAGVEVFNGRLVDEACEHIASLLQKTLFKGMSEVGVYILKTFLADDEAEARSRNPIKSASYRQLLMRCDTLALPVSKSWLNNAVNLALLERSMGGGETSAAWTQLSPTHKVRLLPIRDPKTVAQLADKAVKKKMSTRQLQGAVLEELAKKPKDGRGRPPINPIMKALKGATKIFVLAGGKRSFSKADVGTLDNARVSEALKAANALKARLESLIDKLENRG